MLFGRSQLRSLIIANVISNAGQIETTNPPGPLLLHSFIAAATAVRVRRLLLILRTTISREWA